MNILMIDYMMRDTNEQRAAFWAELLPSIAGRSEDNILDIVVPVVRHEVTTRNLPFTENTPLVAVARACLPALGNAGLILVTKDKTDDHR